MKKLIQNNETEIKFKDLLILVLLAIIWFTLYHHICDDSEKEKRIQNIEAYLEAMSRSVEGTKNGIDNISDNVENISRQIWCDLYEECWQFNNN